MTYRSANDQFFDALGPHPTFFDLPWAETIDGIPVEEIRIRCFTPFVKAVFSQRKSGEDEYFDIEIRDRKSWSVEYSASNVDRVLMMSALYDVVPRYGLTRDQDWEMDEWHAEFFSLDMSQRHAPYDRVDS